MKTFHYVPRIAAAVLAAALLAAGQARAQSSDATLASISSTGNPGGTSLLLVPAFDPDIFSYSTGAGTSHNEVRVAVATTDGGAKVKFTTTGGGFASTGSLAARITSFSGFVSVNMRVTAADGTVKNYTVVVRQVGTPSTKPAVSLAARATALRATWTASPGGEFATAYHVRWRLKDADGAGSGTDPGAWQNASGDDATEAGESAGNALGYTITGLTATTEYEVQVRAENVSGGGAWSDTVAKTTGTGEDATLSALVITGNPGAATLPPAPTFEAETESYRAAAANAITMATVTPTVSVSDATIAVTIDGGTSAAVTSGMESASASMDKGGSAEFAIVVTTADAATTKTYTVAVDRAISAPDAPANIAATAGGRELDVSWDAPTDLGGVNLTASDISYRVRWRTTAIAADSMATPPITAAAAGDWQDLAGDDDECNDTDATNEAMCGVEVAAGTTSYTIRRGLEKDVSYDVAAAAVNAAGAGAWSGDTAAQATPTVSTDATISRLAVSPGALSPAFAADIETYTASIPNAETAISITATLNQENAGVSYEFDGTAAGSASGLTQSVSIDEGETKEIRIVVTADDSTTSKTYTLLVTRPAGAPDAPTGLTVRIGNAALSLDWVAPADTHGAPVSGYQVRWTSDATTWSGEGGENGVSTGDADPAWTITGLQNGTAYAVSVAAVNSAGAGAWTAVTMSGGNFTRAHTPNANRVLAPANLRGISADATSLMLSWDAVSGASGYQVRWKEDDAAAFGTAASATGETHTLSSLTTDTVYDVQVSAVNSNGQGAWTSGSFPVVGAANADLGALVVSAGGSSLPLQFSAATASYALTAPNDATSATVTPFAAHAGATIMVTVGGAAAATVASGGTSDAGAIPAGAALVFLIEVTSSDASASKTYTVMVTRLPLTFSAVQPDLRFHADGNALQPAVLAAANEIFPPVAYTLSGALPGGMSFDAAARTLSGALESVTAAADFPVTLTATDSATPPNTAAQSFTIRIAPPPAFATAPVASLSFTFNAAIPATTFPQASGGFAPISYSFAGDALPAGLSFAADTRILAGTPTDAGAFQLAYQATDAVGANGIAAGIARADIRLEVAAIAAAAPADLAATPANERLLLVWTAPSGDDAGGDAPSDYRVRWSEGTGTTAWNDADGIATGSDKPAHSLESLTNGTVYAVQVAAVNGAGIGAWSDSVEATPANVLAFVSQQEDLVFLREDTVEGVALPEAQGGTSPYTYTVSGNIGTLTGLSFTESTRTISGTISQTSLDAVITYTVTDNTGATAEQSFTITPVFFDLDLDLSDVRGTPAPNVHDGIITARYLLGVRGPALLRGQSNGSISDHQSTLKDGVDSKALDVNGDGVANGDDGILIVRYMFGLRGNELFDGFTPLPQGVTEDDVLDNIEALIPSGA